MILSEHVPIRFDPSIPHGNWLSRGKSSKIMLNQEIIQAKIIQGLNINSINSSTKHGHKTMGQVLYSPAKEYRIMEGHDREAEALQSG